MKQESDRKGSDSIFDLLVGFLILKIIGNNVNNDTYIGEAKIGLRGTEAVFRPEFEKKDVIFIFRFFTLQNIGINIHRGTYDLK